MPGKARTVKTVNLNLEKKIEKVNESPCCVYDFRSGAENVDHDSVIKTLREVAKKWVFQKEKGGKNGYIHFQGRLSLKRKMRKHEALKLLKKNGYEPNYLEKTSKVNRDNDFYVTKDETKIMGPWKDSDVETYIPTQYQIDEMNLYDWQKQIIKSLEIKDNRKINVIYCESGCSGKTTIANYCKFYKNGVKIAPLNDAKELIQILCNICMSKKDHAPNPVIIDLPRAMDKKALNGIWNACEQIKDGNLYDPRHKYKEWDIQSPIMWVFTNSLPNLDLLSKDRWNIWKIKNKKLEIFNNNNSDSDNSDDDYILDG